MQEIRDRSLDILQRQADELSHPSIQGTITSLGKEGKPFASAINDYQQKLAQRLEGPQGALPGFVMPLTQIDDEINHEIANRTYIKNLIDRLMSNPLMFGYPFSTTPDHEIDDIDNSISLLLNTDDLNADFKSELKKVQTHLKNLKTATITDQDYNEVNRLITLTPTSNPALQNKLMMLAGSLRTRNSLDTQVSIWDRYISEALKEVGNNQEIKNSLIELQKKVQKYKSPDTNPLNILEESNKELFYGEPAIANLPQLDQALNDIYEDLIRYNSPNDRHGNPNQGTVHQRLAQVSYASRQLRALYCQPPHNPLIRTTLENLENEIAAASGAQFDKVEDAAKKLKKINDFHSKIILDNALNDLNNILINPPINLASLKHELPIALAKVGDDKKTRALLEKIEATVKDIDTGKIDVAKYDEELKQAAEELQKSFNSQQTQDALKKAKVSEDNKKKLKENVEKADAAAAIFADGERIAAFNHLQAILGNPPVKLKDKDGKLIKPDPPVTEDSIERAAKEVLGHYGVKQEMDLDTGIMRTVIPTNLSPAAASLAMSAVVTAAIAKGAKRVEIADANYAQRRAAAVTALNSKLILTFKEPGRKSHRPDELNIIFAVRKALQVKNTPKLNSGNNLDLLELFEAINNPQSAGLSDDFIKAHNLDDNKQRENTLKELLSLMSNAQINNLFRNLNNSKHINQLINMLSMRGTGQLINLPAKDVVAQYQANNLSTDNLSKILNARCERDTSSEFINKRLNPGFTTDAPEIFNNINSTLNTADRKAIFKSLSKDAQIALVYGCPSGREIAKTVVALESIKSETNIFNKFDVKNAGDKTRLQDTIAMLIRHSATEGNSNALNYAVGKLSKEQAKAILALSFQDNLDKFSTKSLSKMLEERTAANLVSIYEIQGAATQIKMLEALSVKKGLELVRELHRQSQPTGGLLDSDIRTIYQAYFDKYDHELRHSRTPTWAQVNEFKNVLKSLNQILGDDGKNQLQNIINSPGSLDDRLKTAAKNVLQSQASPVNNTSLHSSPHSSGGLTPTPMTPLNNSYDDVPLDEINDDDDNLYGLN